MREDYTWCHRDSGDAFVELSPNAYDYKTRLDAVA